jgi:bifunctional enzyme CysN/CysC
LDFRGFAGQIAGGEIRPGDRVKSIPSGTESTVDRIVTYDGDLGLAHAGQSVTITLADEIDVSRGDVLVAVDAPCGVADQFQATVLWMDDKPMMPSRPYVMKIGAREATVTPSQLKHKINVNTLAKEPTKTLALNEIGVCNISVDRPIAFDPYTKSRATGGFVMIDRMTNNTIGLGLINFELRRASNIHWEAMDIDKEARAKAKGQKPVIIWFTGLSGAGKSTIANIVEQRLHARGCHTTILDGDNVRHGLNRDLGFTEADRVENVRRVSEVSKLMVDAGLITLSCFISPFRSERKMARERVGDDEFVEVFVDTPIEVAEARDAKGLYKKARAGEIKNFTGIDSPYEAPLNPEIHLLMTGQSAEDAASTVIEWLEGHGYIR